jgi:hypothetical protein
MEFIETRRKVCIISHTRRLISRLVSRRICTAKGRSDVRLIRLTRVTNLVFMQRRTYHVFILHSRIHSLADRSTKP